MAEIEVKLTGNGGAYVRLGDAEVRESVALDALEESGSIAALGSIVLDFDHYGRLTGIEVLDSADSALPPRLLHEADGG